jgi:hypothetical protein
VSQEIEPAEPRRAENPFATRRTRPGAVPFVFPPKESADSLLERLRAQGWWGQIVGPHGTGKSTLLAALRPLLQAAGRQMAEIALHDGQRRLPAEFWSGPWTSNTQVVIDGYEQLSQWARHRLKWRCRRLGCGLLVTGHAPLGLPEVFCTRADLDTARQVVERLAGTDSGTVNSQDLTERFQAHGGNLREVLFDLYDLHESRRLA